MSFYTYAHYKKDTGELFYIGKGSGDRFKMGWSKSGHRSLHWAEVANKHGFKPEILAIWPTEQEACDHEKLLIQAFRDMGVGLVNKLIGGGGKTGSKRTREVCADIGNRSRGMKKPPEHLEKLRAAKLLIKGVRLRVDVVSKLRASFAAPIICKETGQKFGAICDAEDWLDKEFDLRSKGSGGITRHLAGKQKKAYGFTWERQFPALVN